MRLRVRASRPGGRRPPSPAFAGCFVDPEFLSRRECSEQLDEVATFRREHDLPLIERPGGARPLRYRVIDGEHVARWLPGVREVAERVRRVVAGIAPDGAFFLDDTAAAVNVNIVPPGGSYRWHYDRNAYTGLVYLNAVADGEIELFPNYRLRLGPEGSLLQRLTDGTAKNDYVRALLGKKVVVRPLPGTLLVMRGDRCLHSVAPVGGKADRVSLVTAFDLPGKTFAGGENLDRYLYSNS